MYLGPAHPLAGQVSTWPLYQLEHVAEHVGSDGRAQEVMNLLIMTVLLYARRLAKEGRGRPALTSCVLSGDIQRQYPEAA